MDCVCSSRSCPTPGPPGPAPPGPGPPGPARLPVLQVLRPCLSSRPAGLTAALSHRTSLLLWTLQRHCNTRAPPARPGLSWSRLSDYKTPAGGALCCSATTLIYRLHFFKMPQPTLLVFQTVFCRDFFQTNRYVLHSSISIFCVNFLDCVG